MRYGTTLDLDSINHHFSYMFKHASFSQSLFHNMQVKPQESVEVVHNILQTWNSWRNSTHSNAIIYTHHHSTYHLNTTTAYPYTQYHPSKPNPKNYSDSPHNSPVSNTDKLDNTYSPSVPHHILQTW